MHKKPIKLATDIPIPAQTKAQAVEPPAALKDTEVHEGKPKEIIHRRPTQTLADKGVSREFFENGFS
jgi:hypothetical protein